MRRTRRTSRPLPALAQSRRPRVAWLPGHGGGRRGTGAQNSDCGVTDGSRYEVASTVKEASGRETCGFLAGSPSGRWRYLSFWTKGTVCRVQNLKINGIDGEK